MCTSTLTHSHCLKMMGILQHFFSNLLNNSLIFNLIISISLFYITMASNMFWFSPILAFLHSHLHTCALVLSCHHILIFTLPCTALILIHTCEGETNPMYYQIENWTIIERVTGKHVFATKISCTLSYSHTLLHSCTLQDSHSLLH